MDSNPDDPVQELDQVSEPDEPFPTEPDENRTDTTEPDDPPPTDSDINPAETSEPVERTTLEPDSSVPGLLNSLTLEEPSREGIHQRHVSNGSLPADFYTSTSDEIEIVEEEEEGLGSSSGGGGAATWTNRGDGPPSPSSSGYAAERGSSVASSGEIEEETERDADWGREKKHLHEVWVFD